MCVCMSAWHWKSLKRIVYVCVCAYMCMWGGARESLSFGGILNLYYENSFLKFQPSILEGDYLEILECIF